MQTQVKAWGNSQGIKLPKELLQDAGISLIHLVKLLDLRVREHKKTGRINLGDKINITDAVQGMFEIPSAFGFYSSSNLIIVLLLY